MLACRHVIYYTSVMKPSFISMTSSRISFVKYCQSSAMAYDIAALLLRKVLEKAESG